MGNTQCQFEPVHYNSSSGVHFLALRDQLLPPAGQTSPATPRRKTKALLDKYRHQQDADHREPRRDHPVSSILRKYTLKFEPLFFWNFISHKKATKSDVVIENYQPFFWFSFH